MAKGKYEKWLTTEGLLQLEAWARNGLTDEQIAKNMGVSVATLYNYKKVHLEILESLKKGKEVVDIQVENALLKSALGYQYTETTKESVYNPGNQKFEFRVSKEVTKEVQGNTTAQIFWLKNRKPDMWRDRKDIDLNANVNNLNPYAGLTTEELKKLIDSG